MMEGMVFFSFVLLVCLSLHVNSKRFVVEMDVEQEIINLKNELLHLKRQLGSTYTRWGRTSCPGNGTDLVYAGYMAGTYHTTNLHGTGGNYLCLSDSPTWDHYSETINNNIVVTGVEYEFSHHISDLSAFFGADIHNADAPCALCRSERSVNVMIPGRTDCYSGWTKEYSGYLVGAYPGFEDASEYVCLDRRPDMIPHSGNDDNDNILYFVEAKCGKGLSCPPYVNNRELACVVCSV